MPRDTPLTRHLAAAIRGEVRFDDGSRAAYSTDASNYRQVPLGVVFPRDADDVIAAIAVCREHDVPITSRGGGTSLAGQACNTGVIIDHSRYFNRVVSVDPSRATARVEPGCILDRLRDAAAAHALTFGPDPATHDRNTLGGMIGNNSCGVHSVMAQFYGPGPLTRHQVVDLDIVTYRGDRMTVGGTSPDLLASIDREGGARGEIYRELDRLRRRYDNELRTGFPDIPRRVSGYNLDALLDDNGFDVAQSLVGSEGTCVTVLGATLRLMPQMPERVLLVLGYPDAFAAADQVPLIMEHRPVGLEGMDHLLVEAIRARGMSPDALAALPAGEGWLLVEFASTGGESARTQALQLMSKLSGRRVVPAMRLAESGAVARQLWRVREAALGAAAITPGLGPTHEGWEDAAVAPEQLGSYLRAFRALLDEFGYHTVLYGHFGQGCVHCRIDFDLATERGVAQWMRFLERATDLVVAHGGSISGEHGDGQARGALLERMYGRSLVNAFVEYKTIWDPDNRMNPGKMVLARRPDQDLRVGPGRRSLPVKTTFAFAADGGSFAHAVDRCVGVGACRRENAGTMCPSYMVTGDEKHSTRGRARILFEMLQGEVIADGWKSEAVHDALDLCFACKGCKSDCPVGVDMAAYKAEFLSHYYQGRLRPRAGYAMGLVRQWAAIGAPIAPLANALMHSPLAPILKRVAGIAPARNIPRLASPTFRRWFTHRARPGKGERVIVWPDTFSNYFRTGPARAAVEVLERAGYTVELPRAQLCCGRPLYDWGMLDRATRLWRRTLTVLRPAIDAGTPIIGIEPSCVAAFRDELLQLFPNDARAARLSRQVFTVSEFLLDRGAALPRRTRQALVHGHCHEKSVIGTAADLDVLDRIGVSCTVPDSGCCGMAGAFGFEAHKYDVSIRAGERALAPAVRGAGTETVIVANGFSCAEQIAHLTGRPALHIAEVIAAT